MPEIVRIISTGKLKESTVVSYENVIKLWEKYDNLHYGVVGLWHVPHDNRNYDIFCGKILTVKTGTKAVEVKRDTRDYEEMWNYYKKLVREGFNIASIVDSPTNKGWANYYVIW